MKFEPAEGALTQKCPFLSAAILIRKVNEEHALFPQLLRARKIQYEANFQIPVNEILDINGIDIPMSRTTIKAGSKVHDMPAQV